jgi:hypothetical protein
MAGWFGWRKGCGGPDSGAADYTERPAKPVRSSLPGPRNTAPEAAINNPMEIGMNVREELEKVRDGLMQQRDELLVQLNLAKLEAREEWEETEQKLEELKAKLDHVADEAKDASDDVWTGVKMLGEEILTAYERIKRTL